MRCLCATAVAGLACLAAVDVPAAATRPAAAPAPAVARPAYGALPPNPTPSDRLLDAYFRDRAAAVAAGAAADLDKVATAADWDARRDEHRRELADMLGLWPTPPRTDLKPVVTGRLDHPDFTVDKLHFQSMPGLYVTANLYVPKNRPGKLPTILYLCGHSLVKDPKTGASLGNKVGYQHHGAWFARNGYACLVIDTLQLGEIEGLHHGLYRENQWWWMSRGYTPAGVEAWNAMRALDYLQTRPEVDATKFGVTGRSGGGAYTWYTAALDERVKVAVPVAGITDLSDHVAGGVIEGHCDCMFMTNAYRWDFAKVAALVSPRPLLIGNSDKDPIFPLGGVGRVHQQVRRVYELQKADDKLGLLVTEGPHKDTQDLQVPALRWFNRWLKDDVGPLTNYAEKAFEPPQLKVFDALPTDQANTTIQERFVPKAPPPAVPADAAAWAKQRDAWLAGLAAKTFAAWPADPVPAPAVKPLFAVERDGVELRGYDVESQANVPLRLYVAVGAQAKEPKLVVLNVVDEAKWRSELSAYKASFGEELKDLSLPDADPAEAASTAKMLKGQPWAMAYVAVRGVGPTAWSGDAKRLTHLRRRFWLLGETLDGMRVWDVRQAVRAVHSLDRLGGKPAVWLQGERRMAGVALYASLFEPDVARLDLWHLPPTHDGSAGWPAGKGPNPAGEGPDLLNVLRVLDVPAAVALAAERSKVRLYRDPADPAAAAAWAYPAAVAKALGWGEDRVQLRDAGH